MTDAPRAPVCFFLPTLDGGGAERVNVDLANALAGSDQPVILLCNRATGPWRGRVAPAVEVAELGCDRVLSAILPLRRFLRRRRPAAVMSAMTHANIVTLAATRLLGRFPGRVVVQEVAQLAVGRPTARPRVEKLILWLTRWLYALADTVVAISPSIAEELVDHRGRPLPNVRVVPNPIDVAAIAGQARAPVPHPWLAAKTLPVVLAVGRLAPEKDFATLLRAVALARTRRPLRLILLGEGAERPVLTRLATELGLDGEVDLPGFAANPYPFMAHADLIAVSSLAEGFSLVLAEALACGCNAVTTDCGAGPVGILDHGRHGRIVPPRDPAALAEAILATLAAPLPAEPLRERARLYDLPVVTALYRELVTGPQVSGRTLGVRGKP